MYKGTGKQTKVLEVTGSKRVKSITLQGDYLSEGIGEIIFVSYIKLTDGSMAEDDSPIARLSDIQSLLTKTFAGVTGAQVLAAFKEMTERVWDGEFEVPSEVSSEVPSEAE